MLSRYLSNITMGQLPVLHLSREPHEYFSAGVTIHLWIEWYDSAYLLNQAIAPWRRADDEIPF